MKFKLLLSLFFIVNLAFGSSIGQQPASKNNSEVILLTENNHALLRDQVTEDSVAAVIERLSLVINKRGILTYPIYLVLDTPGGSVDAGFRLYEFLKTYNNVHTITIGSYSMGAVLVEMLPGERLIVETGTIMFHRMAVMYGRHIPIHQVDSRTKYLLGQEQLVIRKIAQRTGIDIKELQAMIDADLYMGSEEAVQKNFIDRVVPVRCSKQLLDKKASRTIPGGGFLPDITIERSACPLAL